jgi:hypothetical protein
MRQKNRQGGASKLFYAVALFYLSVGETRFAFITNTRFGQIQIIAQVLQFLAKRGKLDPFLSNRTDDGFFQGFNHKRLFDYRFYGSQ